MPVAAEHAPPLGLDGWRTFAASRFCRTARVGRDVRLRAPRRRAVVANSTEGGRAAAHERTRSRRDSSSLRTPERNTMSTETEQLRVEIEPGDGAVVLLLDGELDPHTAPILRRELDALVAKGSTTVVLDMRALRFI